MRTCPTLTAEQRAAVSAEAGPLLIVAGPGSGKTLVLAARVAFLIRQLGIPSRRVLALTFATRAAQELRGRLSRLLGEPGQEVDVATFHAFGLRLIRRWPEPLGLASEPVSVLPNGQAQRLLCATAAAVGVDLGRWTAAESASALEQLRCGEGSIRALPPWSTLLDSYDRSLQRQGAVDFPAMLTWPLRLFREHPAALRLVRDHYRAVLADEAQDCCLAQYRLMQHLAAEHRQLVLVGDPRQAIYAWRGADGEVLRRFGREFPERRVVRLAQNFRSSRQIVALANTLAAPLADDGPLWTRNPAGESVRAFLAADEDDEARFVAAEAARLLGAGAVASAGEIAVLYRINQQRDPLARALRARRMPVAYAADDAAVRLSTIHQAKGAEWSVVFVVGLEEGLLPHYHALESGSDEDLLAERRLAYVAVTRARSHLYLTCCRQRRLGSVVQPRRPSRFLAGLPTGTLARAA